MDGDLWRLWFNLIKIGVIVAIVAALTLGLFIGSKW